MAHEHSWNKLQDIWKEPEGPHPRSKQGHQPNDENGNGHKRRSSKKPKSADHPFYTKHRPDDTDHEEWMMTTIYEAEPDYSEDDESATVTQDNVNDIQERYNMHHTEDDNVEPIMTVAANFKGKWLRANDPTTMYTIKTDLVVLRDEIIKIVYHNGAELSLLTQLEAMRGKLTMDKNKIEWENQTAWKRNLPDIEYSKAFIKARAASPRAAQRSGRVPAVIRKELATPYNYITEDMPQVLSHRDEINEEQPDHNGNGNKELNAHEGQTIRNQ